MKADEKKNAFDLHAGPQLESPGPRASYMESDSPHEGAINSRGSVWAHSSVSQREVGKKKFYLAVCRQWRTGCRRPVLVWSCFACFSVGLGSSDSFRSIFCTTKIIYIFLYISTSQQRVSYNKKITQHNPGCYYNLLQCSHEKCLYSCVFPFSFALVAYWTVDL